MDALVDHGLRLHNLRRHFWWVTLRVWVDLEVKAPWVGAVPVVVVGIHCSHAELVCAAWTDHMLASLTKSFATMVFQNKQKRELISAQLFFLPCAVVGHFLYTCATVSKFVLYTQSTSTIISGRTCATWTDHMLQSLTKSFQTTAFQNKHPKKAVNQCLIFSFFLVGHFVVVV